MLKSTKPTGVTDSAVKYVDRAQDLRRRPRDGFITVPSARPTRSPSVDRTSRPATDSIAAERPGAFDKVGPL